MAIIRIFADNIEWKCRRMPQSENWVAECDVLGLTVQSSRYSELAEDIGDTLDLLFGDLFSGDELDQFLTAHGWTRTHEVIEGEPSDAVFDVPFELLAAEHTNTPLPRATLESKADALLTSDGLRTPVSELDSNTSGPEPSVREPSRLRRSC